jgi:hypothetical protein
MAKALGTSSRVQQLCREFTLDAESSYQNAMARNNKILKVNYSASPNYFIFLLPPALLLFVVMEFYLGILTKARYRELANPLFGK